MEYSFPDRGSGELQHWGIKGQKWGVRRFQNEDGTYTEEGIKRYNKKYPYQDANTGSLNEKGQKEYMRAARKGQLDYKRLSDKELDMINNRFNKENQFKKNISDYEKSKFSNRLKEAVVTRIKGGGGGGGGKGKGKGKGKSNSIAGLLVKPITDALKEAMNMDSSSGGDGGDGGNGSAKESQYERGKGFLRGGKNLAIRDLVTNERVRTGARYMGAEHNRSSNSDNDFPKWNPSKRSPEEMIREGRRNAANENSRYWSFDDYSIDHSAFVITRSDELVHWGIKGQKWGVRRFENADGTLTEEGKARYRSSESQRALSDTVKSSVRRYKGDSTNWYHPDKEDDRVASVGFKLRRHPVVRDAAKRVSSDLKNYRDAADAVHKEERAFYNNEKVYEKYLNMAVNHFMKEVGPEWGTRENAYDWFKYDDGDQGNHSSIELYKRSPEGKKLVALEKTERDAYTNYVKACKKYVSDYTGEFGDEKVKYPDGFERTVNERLSDYVREIAENNKYYKA